MTTTALPTTIGAETEGGSDSVGDLRIAVLGLGLMGSYHVDVLSTAIKGATVAVVNDFVPEKATEVAHRLGARVVADPIDAINDAGVDAVLLATPGDTHFEQVSACLDRGIPVLCEKPLTTDVDTAYELVQAEAELGRSLSRWGSCAGSTPSTWLCNASSAAADSATSCKCIAPTGSPPLAITSIPSS